MRHGSMIDPPNRFERTRHEADLEHLEWDQEYLTGLNERQVEYLTDASKSIVSENDSPDVGFRYSVNPYRGCQHGCSYCYARNSHEYLGLNAGLDFETKIIVKQDAPQLLRDFLSKKSWKPEVIVFSGVTDCYQPAERQFKLTRQCLEVALECHQPVGIITKNALVVRDIDILREMASLRLVHVNISVTSLDPELARIMEPRTSTPAARLRAIQTLTAAKIPARVMVAPIIPGLNDSEIPAILGASKDAGAGSAGHVLLRLPLSVRPVFVDVPAAPTAVSETENVPALVNFRYATAVSSACRKLGRSSNRANCFRRAPKRPRPPCWIAWRRPPRSVGQRGGVQAHGAGHSLELHRADFAEGDVRSARCVDQVSARRPARAYSPPRSSR
jgi:DNA repair photolyase